MVAPQFSLLTALPYLSRCEMHHDSKQHERHRFRGITTRVLLLILLELFQGEAGCIRCHDGPLLSDGRFHRLGVSFTDEGRAAVTGNPEDRARFRTPSLRDVAETGPYMHNGSIKTLDAVIEFYLRSIPASGPDGLTIDVEPVVGLSYSDVTALVAFLRSLSGTPPPAPQIRPATPE